MGRRREGRLGTGFLGLNLLLNRMEHERLDKMGFISSLYTLNCEPKGKKIQMGRGCSGALPGGYQNTGQIP